MKQRKEYIDIIRSTLPTSECLTIQLGECKILVKANTKEIKNALQEYFGSFVIDQVSNHDILITVHECYKGFIENQMHGVCFAIKNPDPGKTKIKEEFIDLLDGRIVKKRLTGMFFIFGHGDHLAIGPCLQNLNQVINFINNRFIEWKLCRGSILGHASGINFEGKGLAIAGFSGAGKSTLALKIMNLGASFVSNDRIMVRKTNNGLAMSGVAKLPRINPGTVLNNPQLESILSEEERIQFSNLSKDELWHLEHKYDASIDICYGPNRFLLESPMHGLVILNWTNGYSYEPASQVNISDRVDLLPAFMKSTGLFFLPHSDCFMPAPTIESYIDHLSCCSVWEFNCGIDFENAAQACIHFLKEL